MSCFFGCSQWTRTWTKDPSKVLSLQTARLRPIPFSPLLTLLLFFAVFYGGRREGAKRLADGDAIRVSRWNVERKKR